MEEYIIQINDGLMTNVNVSVKNVRYIKKDYIWNPSTCGCENRKHLASIMDYSGTMCDEIMESYKEEGKNIQTNFNEKKKKKSVKRKIYIFYFHFY